MSIDTLRVFLLWCTIINYAILMLWWILLTQAHDWMNRMLCRWVVQLPDEKIDLMQLYGITFYKLAIVLFNFVPFIALSIVKR